MFDDLDPKQLFSSVETKETVLVAVSGGSDSIALLMLANAWAQVADVHLQALTVDHGLRPEAAAEAAFVAGICEAIGVPHVTLAWEGMKPQSGISSAARDARYRLIEEFALDLGATQVLTGHTANDQAETVLMRNARYSSYTSGRGLSGMAPKVMLPRRTMLVRPLLRVLRASLRAYLTDMQQSWIEDPSNQDETYERVRVRKALGEEAHRIAEICRFAELVGRDRKLSAVKVADALKEHMEVSNGPVFSVPLDLITSLENPHRVLLLQVLTAMAGGGEHFIPKASAMRFFDFPNEVRITAGNAILERHGEQLRVFREIRNLETISIMPGEEYIWDGRLQVSNLGKSVLSCGPLDAERIKQLEDMRGEKLDVKPRSAASASPVIYGANEAYTLPFVDSASKIPSVDASMICPAIEHFCPEFDFSLLEIVDKARGRFNPEFANKPKDTN